MEKLNAFGFGFQPALYSDAALADGVRGRVNELDQIYVNAKSQAEQIDKSGKYTAKGKQEAYKALSAEVDAEIKKWRVVESHYRDQVRQLNEQMQPSRSRADDVVGELRRVEIRNYLRQLDPVEAEAAYMEAAQKGDDLFLAAIAESPIPFRFSTANLVEKVNMERLKRAYPKEAERLENLQVAQQDVNAALKTAREALGKLGINLASLDLLRSEAA